MGLAAKLREEAQRLYDGKAIARSVVDNYRDAADEIDRLTAALRQVAHDRNSDAWSVNLAKVTLGERGVGAMLNQEAAQSAG